MLPKKAQGSRQPDRVEGTECHSKSWLGGWGGEEDAPKIREGGDERTNWSLEDGVMSEFLAEEFEVLRAKVKLRLWVFVVRVSCCRL